MNSEAPLGTLKPLWKAVVGEHGKAKDKEVKKDQATAKKKSPRPQAERSQGAFMRLSAGRWPQ